MPPVDDGVHCFVYAVGDLVLYIIDRSRMEKIRNAITNLVRYKCWNGANLIFDFITNRVDNVSIYTYRQRPMNPTAQIEIKL